MKTCVKNYSNQKCDDDMFGEIKYGASGWDWVTIEKERKKRMKLSETETIDQNKDQPVIILVLESPHSSEYTSNGYPIRPAMGKSGKNIYSYFCLILNNTSPINKFSNQCNELQDFLKLHEYEQLYVWIANSVQKQCSLGIKPINQIIKESNWIDEWLDNGYNFASNLDKITLDSKRDFFIINLCTKGEYVPMKIMVEDKLNDYLSGNNNYCSGPHPSSWGRIKKVHFT